MRIVLGGALASAGVGDGLWAQSDVAFPTDAYVTRRSALSQRVGKAVVVIAGDYLISPGDRLVKQEPDFWYLTGVESPYAVLLMVPRSSGGGHESYLFVPDQRFRC